MEFRDFRATAGCGCGHLMEPGGSGSHVAHVQAFLQSTAQPRTLRVPTDAPGPRWSPGGPPHGVQQAVAAAERVQANASWRLSPIIEAPHSSGF